MLQIFVKLTCVSSSASSSKIMEGGRSLSQSTILLKSPSELFAERFEAAAADWSPFVAVRAEGNTGALLISAFPVVTVALHGLDLLASASESSLKSSQSSEPLIGTSSWGLTFERRSLEEEFRICCRTLVKDGIDTAFQIMFKKKETLRASDRQKPGEERKAKGQYIHRRRDRMQPMHGVALRLEAITLSRTIDAKTDIPRMAMHLAIARFTVSRSRLCQIFLKGYSLFVRQRKK